MAAQKENGLDRRMVQFRLQDPQPLVYHNEPIWRDTDLVGHITSGAYGHTLGGCIGLGYVHVDRGAKAADILSGSYEIEVAGERIAADASLRPMYDP
ncbi:MAG: glycine cleavage T C-terminal barrel domain-containing protein, partial [Woeseiales bacterium]